MKLLQKYNCQRQVNDQLIQIILRSKKESGQLREFLEIKDCRTFLGMVVLTRFPTLYFETAFDFRWTRASKIIKPGQQPEQDRLSIGAIAAEQMTRDVFITKIQEKDMEEILDRAKKIINPN